MPLAARARKAVKRALLGPDGLPQQCIVAMREPQQEIVVELHGLGAPRDVTRHHSLACVAPFTVAIALDELPERPLRAMRLFLHFRERAAPERVLGKLGMRLSAVIPVDGREIHCFEILSRVNYCLPRMRLWTRYLYWACQRWRRPPPIRMAARDVHAMPIFFICPRPVGLVSVADGELGNVFPMDLMGPLGGGLFGFALNSTGKSASQVKRAGRLALSAVPFEQATLVTGLGGNHNRDGIRWENLPFPTTASATLGLPVPNFALRLRELEVAAFRDLGSHTLFVARILHEECRKQDRHFFMIHGIYQEWRKKHAALDAAQGVA